MSIMVPRGQYKYINNKIFIMSYLSTVICTLMMYQIILLYSLDCWVTLEKSVMLEKWILAF